MKIVAGLSGLDAYAASCDAGADEVFCGYVPEKWMARYGLAWPLNRREVRYVNVQLGGRNELLLLAEAASRRGVPVTLAFNSLSYLPAQYPLLGQILDDCLRDGFTRFIIADPALLAWLHAQGFSRRAEMQVSGEVGEINRGMLTICREAGARRMILHRKVPLADMAALIAWDKAAHPASPFAFEAFALNELCHFHGGWCNALHGDEMAPICRVPYLLGGVDRRVDALPAAPIAPPEECPGATGCGLCALWQLRRIGVTHLKLVGRGNLPERMMRDIATLRTAVELAEAAADEETYLAALRREIFPHGCGRNCYYYGETGSIMN